MKEKSEKRSLFKKIITMIGIILTGVWGIVWLGGDKITSGTLLILTMIIMLLPIKNNKNLRIIRIVFVCIVFCFVIWNISTTDLPTDRPFIANPYTPDNSGESGETYSTGIRFFDQVIHIFKGFLEGRIFQSR